MQKFIVTTFNILEVASFAEPNFKNMKNSGWISAGLSREVLLNATRNSDVGPLQALIDELEFNVIVSEHYKSEQVGCLFLDDQFRGAVRQGAIATLIDELKLTILEAYRAMGSANQAVASIYLVRPSFNDPKNVASTAVFQARSKVIEARNALLKFLSSDA